MRRTGGGCVRGWWGGGGGLTEGAVGCRWRGRWAFVFIVVAAEMMKKMFFGRSGGSCCGAIWGAMAVAVSGEARTRGNNAGQTGR